ncbi:MAG: GntR family transcriptional regulator [Clostridia bacterium]|jgi:DNA-binding FadR family transcriptional regulator|nr:GntR family transcriptional regulator [Clostridia bacterium]MCI1999773.1 GntR family transcriptional regulator [Clostridia bacterium]MCI2014311.1 GntR family transcriptional regulator [Clostridia bacterium]
MEIKPLKKVTLTEQVMEQIANMVTSGSLKPGDKLPNEREMAQSFHVTRSRVREALRALSLIGMIEIKPGDGSFVSKENKIPKEVVTWIYRSEINKHDEVYAARNLIETEVYLTCFDNKTDEVLEQINNYVKILLEIDIAETSAEDFCQLISEIDLYIGDNCGNSVYSKLMQILVLIRKESSLKVLSLESSKSSAILYRTRILNSFNQDKRAVLEKQLHDFFKSSIKEISIH